MPKVPKIPWAAWVSKPARWDEKSPRRELTAEARDLTVDTTYDRRSIALSSNLHPVRRAHAKVHRHATVDRLLHPTHLVITAGDSMRLMSHPGHPRSGPSRRGRLRRRLTVS
jgi:hypothetical protein